MMTNLADTLRRCRDAVLVRGPLRLLRAHARTMGLSRLEHRFLRARLLRSAAARLRAVEQILRFPAGILVSADEIWVDAGGVFLPVEGNNRYFKASAAEQLNAGWQILSFCDAHDVSVGTFIDVGAQDGEIALLIARQRPRSRVLAIEANPSNFMLMRRTIAFNERFGALSQITLAAVAVSDHRGTVEITQDRGSENTIMTASEGGRALPPGTQTVSVPCNTLSAILAENSFERADVVKLNIEGAEPLLRASLIELQPKAMLIEFSNWNSAEANLELFDALVGAGYRCYERGGAPLGEDADARAFLARALGTNHPGLANATGTTLWFLLHP